MPSPRIRSISLRSSAVSVAFIPAAGSSRASRSGSVASARAISRRRWSPYERLLRELVGVLADAGVVEQFFRASGDRRLLRARGGVAQHGAPHACTGAHVPPDHHVLERGHVGEEADVLKRARDAGGGDSMRLATSD